MIDQQMTFSELRWPEARPSNLQIFLDRLDAAIDVDALMGEFRPHFPLATGRGRPRWAPASILRLMCLQTCLSWNDREAEDALINLPAVCRWCGIDDHKRRPPDAETLAGYRRHLAECLDRGNAIEEALLHELKRCGLRLVKGSTVEPRLNGGGGFVC